MESETVADPAHGEAVADLMTAQEAAAFLGVTDAAIRQAWHGKRLPYMERYGRKLIPRAALVEYKERSQPDGKAKVGRPARLAK